MDVTKIILMTVGALLTVGLFYVLCRQLMRSFLGGMRNLGNHLIRSFFNGLAQIETQDEEKPKSLPQMENMILPQVLRDFPDFDLAMAKNQIHDHLTKLYGGRKEFLIHNVVLSEYHKTSVKRSIVFQAAVCWRSSKLVQKRLQISMEYQCVKNKRNPAINCPNCGATLGFGDLTCKYCGTRINDRRDQEWAFASIREV